MKIIKESQLRSYIRRLVEKVIEEGTYSSAPGGSYWNTAGFSGGSGEKKQSKSERWWNTLSKDAQEKYIDAHPHTKLGKSILKKVGAKNIKSVYKNGSHESLAPVHGDIGDISHKELRKVLKPHGYTNKHVSKYGYGIYNHPNGSSLGYQEGTGGKVPLQYHATNNHAKDHLAFVNSLAPKKK